MCLWSTTVCLKQALGLTPQPTTLRYGLWHTDSWQEGLKPVENYKNGLESASFCFTRKTPHILTILYKKSSGGVFTCNVNGTEQIKNNKVRVIKKHLLSRIVLETKGSRQLFQCPCRGFQEYDHVLYCK